MANSTSNIDTILTSQAQKEVTANALFDSFSPASSFGRRATTTSALTWGYYGGTIRVAGVPTQISNGTIALTASDTNYLYLTAAGAVTKTTTEPTGWPGPLADDAVALYEIVTGTATVTSYTDYRISIGEKGASWSVLINAQTGTTYSLQDSDNGKVVTLNNGSSITLTIPSGLSAAFCCQIIQLGAGQVTVAAGGGVTLNSYYSLTKLAGQHAAATIVAYASETYNIAGALSA